MKNKIIKLTGTLVIVLAFLSSCDKERKDSEQFQSITLDNIVELTNQRYLDAEITGGDEQTSFFIVNEGLIDEYIATERLFASHDKSVNNRLIRCLNSVNLDDEQIPQVRRALKAYEQRNERILHKHRETFANLHTRMERQRNELIRQLRNGEIERAEFNRKMAQLREQYQQALRRIKESNASELSRSFRMLMQNLQNIMNERQWNAFIGCLRS